MNHDKVHKPKVTVPPVEDEVAKGPHWLNPLNKLRIQMAVKERAESVVLNDGREFSITYEEKWKHNGKTRPATVWLQLAPSSANDGHPTTVRNGTMLIPCGRFELRQVLDPNWAEQE